MWKVITLILLSLLNNVGCAKILGVFITTSRSHHIVGERLMKELAARGHDVTIISPFPQKTPVKNLRDIELTGFIEDTAKIMDKTNLFEMAKSSPLTMPLFVATFTMRLAENCLSHKNVQKLLHSNETFDLIIKEQFGDDVLQGFGYHYKAPVLILSTVGPTIWTSRLISNPVTPSYMVDVFLDYPPKMTFLQRTYNTIMTLVQEITHLYFIKVHNDLMHKHFPDAPHINNTGQPINIF